jgi:methyl-accepting chemotaxis protein
LLSGSNVITATGKKGARMRINRYVKTALVVLGFMLATAAIAEIRSLTKRLAVVEATAEELRSKTDEQSSEMDDVKTEMEDMKAKIDELQDEAQTQSSEVNNVKSDVDDIKTKLEMP